MVFKMNKPVVHGSKEHSALLAKAERIPTHGADPTIMAAAADYGKSNSPDVIDWRIKMADIKLKEKEEEEDDVVAGCMDSKAKNYNARATKSDGSCKYDEEKKEEVIHGADLFEKEEDDPDDYPGGVDDPNLTLNERKEITAENDRIEAINRLKLKKVAVDEPSDKPIEAIKEYKASYKPGTLQQGSDPNLPPSKNLVKPTVVSKEDVDLGRVVMTKDGYRETDWYTKQKKKVTKTTQKRKEVEKKTTTKKKSSLEDLKYKLAGPSGRAKMIKKGYVPK